MALKKQSSCEISSKKDCFSVLLLAPQYKSMQRMHLRRLRDMFSTLWLKSYWSKLEVGLLCWHNVCSQTALVVCVLCAVNEQIAVRLRSRLLKCIYQILWVFREHSMRHGAYSSYVTRVFEHYHIMC